MKIASKRIEWVDIGKCICALFVIIIHLESNTALLGKFYEPFLLNGFLFLSGYTFSYRPGFKQFLKRKTKQLLIPWLFFGMLVVISGNLYSPSPDAHNGLLIDLFWFFVQIREKNDAMWFVSALFVAYIPFYYLIGLYQKKHQNKNHTILLILFVTLLYYLGSLYGQKFPKHLFPWDSNKLPWHTEYIPNALFFMTLGYLYRHKIEERLKKYEKPLVILFIFVFYLYLVYGNAWVFFDKKTETRIIFWILREVCAVTLLVGFSKLIKPSKVMLYIGQNSLIYFGIAHYLNVIIQLILKIAVPGWYAAILSNEYHSAIFSIVFAILSSLILTVPAYIINRYFPFLIGRSVQSKQN